VYGRSFEGTAGLGKSYSSVGDGTWQEGIWDYKMVPKSGAIVYMDSDVVATYSYDASTQELSRGLGGATYWESSADKKGTESLTG
ncbi:chitinase insertion domain-containing protein, partial [Xylogone sp. PMI_703]